MKKLFTQSLFCLFISSSAFSQIPNPAFESWINYGGACANAEQHPVSWTTSDSVTVCYGAGQSAVIDGTNKCGGLYSIKLISVTSIVGVVPGFATNGAVTGLTTIVGGSPDTARSAQISGCYRYIPASGDTAYISAYLFRWNTDSVPNRRDTVAKSSLQINGTTPQMVPFISNFTYLDWTHQPDSILIILTSTPGVTRGHAGSILYVDSLLLSGYVGISENDFVREVNIFPQPAQNELNVQVLLNQEMEMTYEIIDITGREILNGSIKSGSQRIDINRLSGGNYFISLRNKDKAILYSSKFIVSK
jgi:hypothetical protein